MDPEDPFAGMDPERIRRGSLRTLHALFPDLFAPEPDSDRQEQSREYPAPAGEDQESDPHPEENRMRPVAGSTEA